MADESADILVMANCEGFRLSAGVTLILSAYPSTPQLTCNPARLKLIAENTASLRIFLLLVYNEVDLIDSIRVKSWSHITTFMFFN